MKIRPLTVLMALAGLSLLQAQETTNWQKCLLLPFVPQTKGVVIGYNIISVGMPASQSDSLVLASKWSKGEEGTYGSIYYSPDRKIKLLLHWGYENQNTTKTITVMHNLTGILTSEECNKLGGDLREKFKDFDILIETYRGTTVLFYTIPFPSSS